MEDKEHTTTDQQEPAAKPKPKKGCLARLLKATLITALVIVGLNVVLYILLSIPFVQNKLVGYATDELKSMTGTEVRIDKVRISLFNHATIEGLYVEDLNKDTLLYAQFLDARLSPWKLLSNELLIDNIILDDFVIKVNAKDSVSDYNFQFLIDAFASSDTTQVEDTTASSMQIVISEIDINRGRLHYDILSEPQTPNEFNASHIALSGFKANINLYSIDTEDLDVRVNSLAASEQSGLTINTLKGHVVSEGSLFKTDNLTLELANSHLKVNHAEYNPDTDEFALFTDDIEISPADVRYFLPNAKYITDKLTAHIDVKGKLPQVDAKTIYLALGNNVVLDGSAYIGSYSALANSDVKAEISKLSLTPAGITYLARLGDSTFVAPEILSDMGTVNLTANLSGKLNNLNLDANASVRQGTLKLKAQGAIDTTFTDFDLSANLSTVDFDLGSLLADTTLNHASFHLDADIKQSNTLPLTAEAQGAIDLLQYQGADLKDMPVTAHYNANDMGVTLSGDLPIGKLALNATMTQAEIADVHIGVKVDELDVPFFYQNDYWFHPRLSFRLNGDIKGTDIDKLSAKIALDSLSLKDSTFNFVPGLITLEIDQSTDTDKSITLESKLLSANIVGQYTFSTLPYEISNMMHDYLSAVFPERYTLRKRLNNFFFTLNVENTEEIGRIFQLPVDVIEPFNLKGRISTVDRQIAVFGSIPFLRSGDIEIKNGEFDMFNIDSTFNITLSAAPEFSDGLYDFSLKLNGANNSVHSYMAMGTNNAGDSAFNIKGDIESMTQFRLTDKNQLQTFLQVYQSTIDIDKMQLNLRPARIVHVGDRTLVENFGIDMNRKRYFHAGGYISNLPQDTLTLSFDEAQIGDFLSTFNVNNFKASIDGEIKLTKITDKMEFYTENLEIEDIIIFGDTLGTLNAYCAMNDELGGIRINSKLDRGQTRFALIDGMIYDKDSELDLKVNLDRFPLGWIEPFMAGTLNKLNGSLSAGIDIKGTTKAPITSGFIGFNNTSFGIDYTNVVYTISDTIEISPDKVGFSDLKLFDSEGNKATINATVTHHNFNNLKYSLDTRIEKLMFLNTQSRTDSLFYGKVYATGTVRITGDEDNIRLNMNIRNDNKSNINILVPENTDAELYKGVVYINVPEEKIDKEIVLNVPPNESALPLLITSNITLTPSIELRVVIDPATGDAMHVNGNGKIAFNYDMQKDNMTTFGDYTINDGNVSISLQGLKKLEFRIREGSKLNFIGDPMKTKFNITAYRRVKADLKTLDSSFETGDSSPKVQVDCILRISGDINKMDVTYDIDLPDANDDVKNKVRSIIVTDEQKATQFAYLVIGNTFHSQSGGGNIGNSMWTSVASSTLSSGLNALLGNVLGDKWEIGTNIESGDGTFNDMDMSVDVSTRVFNDRLKLHTNVGYNQSATADGTFIGDFDAEYQLNTNWTLRAFNRTNDRFYKQAPMTQGIGIVYTKEAATLKRLFLPRRRRNRRSQNAETSSRNERRTENKQVENTSAGK